MDLALFPLLELPRTRRRRHSHRFSRPRQLVLIRAVPGGGFSAWQSPGRQVSLSTTRRTGKLVAIIPIASWSPPCKGCPLRAGCRELCAEASPGVPAEEPFNFREKPKDPETASFLASVRWASEHEHDNDEIDPAAKVRRPWIELVDSARPALRQAIEGLTPTQREVILALLAGKRQCDIARDSGKTKETICILVRRARIRLQRAMTADE